MKQVGYFNRTRYWQIYAFNNPPKGYKYKRGINIPFHSIGINNPFLRHTKFVLPFQNCDLYHTYNAVVTGRKPWIIEVETTVPRYGDLKEGNRRFDWGIKKLKSQFCKGIIFTSKYTRKLNQENFKQWEIDPEKCHLVYRAVEPQYLLERTGNEKEFTILFVGNGFYRKGGIELLKAFKKFNKKDARLVIISNFEVDWKIFPTEIEKQFVQEEIEENKQIEVYQSLSHSEVIYWMRKSDVFVNTTYADTFNNAILEALSCQLPVIVSNVRAIPEFVKEGFNGFMVKPDLQNREKMIDHIYKKLEAYYSDTNMLKIHSANALMTVESKFLIDHRSKKLSKIYNSIIG